MLIQDIILCVLFVAGVLSLYATSTQDAAKYNNRWRLFYLIPAIICILHGLIAGVEFCLFGIYMGALVMLGGYFNTKVAFRKKYSIIALALFVITIPACFLGNYRTAPYLADFEEGFAMMKEHYSLTVHKQVDWDALYEEYQPQFAQIEDSQDADAYYTTWTAFCNEFYDAHTTFMPTNQDADITKSAVNSVLGNDYGLSMTRLSTGEYAAVQIEPNSQAADAGIHTGTVITKWDGNPIEELLPEAANRLRQCTIAGNVENEQFYQSLFVPCIGEDQVTVTFVNDAGTEETVTLNAIGTYYDRLMAAYDVLSYKPAAENMGFMIVDEDTVLLNINSMHYDSNTFTSANYGTMQSKIREQLITYHEEGYENLIIDLRNNAGGSSMMARAIVALIADKEFFWAADGAYNEEMGAYDMVKEYTCVGENIWDGGEVIVLVNSASNSAANHLMAGLQKLNNVTVMGLTNPAAAGQGMTGFSLKTGMLSFSMTTVLDENGKILIDSDASGHCNLPVDEVIPLTKEALLRMYENGEDYVLTYATQYFDK